MLARKKLSGREKLHILLAFKKPFKNAMVQNTCSDEVEIFMLVDKIYFRNADRVFVANACR